MHRSVRAMAGFTVALAGALGGGLAAAGSASAAAYSYVETATLHPAGNTGACLDSNTNGFGGGVGSVYTLKCNGGTYQKWKIYVDLSNPANFEFVDVQTGRCLDSNGSLSPYTPGRVYALACNGGSYQAWYWYEGPYHSVVYDVQTGLYLGSSNGTLNAQNVQTKEECDCVNEGWIVTQTS